MTRDALREINADAQARTSEHLWGTVGALAAGSVENLYVDSAEPAGIWRRASAARLSN